MNKYLLTFSLAILLVLVSSTSALAHGAKIEYTINMAVEITAMYDSGEPMAEAQVTIYAPTDLTTPWNTGTTDSQGRFTFTPDPEIPGTWDVQVRQAGHGDIVHIAIGEGMENKKSTGFTPLQTILMSACVVWGFVGTGLYFSRRKD